MKKLFLLTAIVCSLVVQAQTPFPVYVPTTIDSTIKLPASVLGAGRTIRANDLFRFYLTTSKASTDSTTLRSLINSNTTALAALPSTYYQLTGGSLNGNIWFRPQTSVSVPSDGFKLFDSSGIVIVRSDGYRRILSFAGLTGNVKYNFPVASVSTDTITTNTAYSILTNKSISGLSNSITNIQDAALSSNVSLLNAAQTYSGAKTFSSDITINGRTLSTITYNTQTGTSYTLVLSDRSKEVELNNASANTVTVPLNSSVAYPVGTWILIRQTGIGQTTISATGGVTIQSADNATKLRTQYSSAVIKKKGTDTWVLEGDVI